MEAIKVENITKVFRSGRRKQKVIDDFSFSIQEGKITGFIGPNGAGKTTSIKMILGLIRPSNGKISVFGHSNKTESIKKAIGYMPEKDAFYDDMLPLDYLVYLGTLSGMSKKYAIKKANELMELLGLSEAHNKRIGKFSSGMKKKIVFAQAILHNPKLIILDEPTANLDPLAQDQLLSAMVELKKKGTTIFISSHNLEELEKIIDDVIVINKGKLVVQSSMKEIKKKASAGIQIDLVVLKKYSIKEKRSIVCNMVEVL